MSLCLRYQARLKQDRKVEEVKMWSYSLPPKNQPGHAVAQLQQFSDFVSRHRYAAVIAVCLLLVAATMAVIVVQKSAADASKTQQAAIEHAVLPAANQPQAVPSGEPAQPAMSTETQSDSSTTTEFNSDNGQASLKVNNQEIPVPKNGSINRTVPSDDGNSNVNVSVNSSSSGSGTGSSSSSTSVQVNTSSDMSVENSE